MTDCLNNKRLLNSLHILALKLNVLLRYNENVGLERKQEIYIAVWPGGRGRKNSEACVKRCHTEVRERVMMAEGRERETGESACSVSALIIT